MAKAINLYEQAIKVDSSFALAWAKLSFAHQRQALNGWRPIADAISLARTAAERAIRIDPDLAFAHRERGALARDYDWDWKTAQAAYRRANELEPTDFHARADLAFLTGAMFGRFDESIADIREIVARDPLDADALHDMAWLLANAGHLGESVATFRQLLAINPAYAGGQISLGINLLLLGRKEEALVEVDKESDEAYRLSGLPTVYWALGRKSDSDAALATFRQKYAAVGAYNLGQMHAYRGEVNDAIEWLDRAYRQHDPGMVWIKVDLLLRSLHDDPRYQALLAKMRLTEADMRPNV